MLATSASSGPSRYELRIGHLRYGAYLGEAASLRVLPIWALPFPLSIRFLDLLFLFLLGKRHGKPKRTSVFIVASNPQKPWKSKQEHSKKLRVLQGKSTNEEKKVRAWSSCGQSMANLPEKVQSACVIPIFDIGESKKIQGKCWRSLSAQKKCKNKHLGGLTDRKRRDRGH